MPVRAGMSIARVRLRRRRDRHRFSVACKSRNGVRSIGDAKRLVEMLVDGHAASDEVTAQRRGPDLHDPPVELHGVRIRDRPLMLNGKDPLEARRRGDERGPRLSGWTANRRLKAAMPSAWSQALAAAMVVTPRSRSSCGLRPWTVR